MGGTADSIKGLGPHRWPSGSRRAPPPPSPGVFTGDVALPRMAFAKVLRSPLAHARIRSIDTEAARAVTGVLDVVVGSGLLVLPRSRYGHAIRDHAILAMDKVRFIGEPVAAVIAEG